MHEHLSGSQRPAGWDQRGQLGCASSTLPWKDATLVSIQSPIWVDQVKKETNKPGIIPLRKEGDRRATRYTVIIPNALTGLPGVGLMVVDDGGRRWTAVCHC